MSLRRRRAVVAIFATTTVVAGMFVGMVGGPTAAYAATSVTISGTAYAGAAPPDWKYRNPSPITPSTVIQPGISLESTAMLDHRAIYGTNPDAAPTSRIPSLLALLKGSDTGAVLRIGANGADQTEWEGPDADYAIDNSDLKVAAAVTARAGYTAVLTTNLKNDGLRSKSTDMIAHARADWNGTLAAVAFGNEPDHFSTDASKLPTYIARWNDYLSSLRTDGSRLPVWGPEPATKKAGAAQAYFDQFVTNQLSLSKPTVGAVAIHQYNFFHDPDDRSWTAAQRLSRIGTLFDNQYYVLLKNNALRAADAARKLGTNSLGQSVKAVVSERNSIALSGDYGVSNSFASALWVLDTTLLAARSGASTQNLHTTLGVCGKAADGGLTSNAMYSPVCANSESDRAAGKFHAQPEFLGLLAAGRVVGNGTFLDTGGYDNTTSTVHLYAVKSGSSTKLVIINLAANDAALSFSVPAQYTKAVRVDLTVPSAASATDRVLTTDASKVTLGGNTVTYNGSTANWPAPTPAPSALPAPGTWSGSVSGYSAAIVTLS